MAVAGRINRLGAFASVKVMPAAPWYQQRVPVTSQPKSASLSGLRVLVVEDEILLGVELIDELENLGAVPVGPIPSVDEALAAIRNHPFDAAILNVDLRGQLSLPIAEALMACETPFLFVTGNDSFVREHFPEVPVHPKPYDMTTIVEALELLMSKHQRPKETIDAAR